MARVSRRLVPFLTLYLPHWFPAKYRAAIVASFMVAMPISGALLGLRGIRGLDGWQWLFVIEALPAVLMRRWCSSS